jgi:hypothetical protein
LQAKTPTALYTNILAAAYGELSRRIRAQPSLPEASGNTVAPVVVSGDPDKTTAAVAEISFSSVGTSSSASSAAAAAAAASASAAAAAAAFAASLADWPIFPDTIPALAKLSTALGLKLVVLSNVDHASFAHTRAALEHGFAFAATFTAEDIGSYKLRFFFLFVLLWSLVVLRVVVCPVACPRVVVVVVVVVVVPSYSFMGH